MVYKFVISHVTGSEFLHDFRLSRSTGGTGFRYVLQRIIEGCHKQYKRLSLHLHSLLVWYNTNELKFS